MEKTYSIQEAQELLKVSRTMFYKFRNFGVLPAPIAGLGLTKRYTTEQLAEMKKIVADQAAHNFNGGK